MSEKRRGGDEGDGERAPFSRLFLVCNKRHTEDEFREHFSRFGRVEDVWFVKDRATGERKGVAYVQFARTSEAARALEATDGKTIGSSTTRPVKAMVASERCEAASQSGGGDDDKYVRLFVMIPKTMGDEELEREFARHGKVEYANVIRDRETRESKGYGYVKYERFSDAAAAYENADRKYRAIFAEPKRQRPPPPPPSHASQPSDLNGHDGGGGYDDERSELIVVCDASTQRAQLRRLFDVVPGLAGFRYRLDERRRAGVAHVAYSSRAMARRACDKLHGFEYPPGCELSVRPERRANDHHNDHHHHHGSGAHPMDVMDPARSVARLAETIAHATSLIRAAAATAAGGDAPSFCSAALPAPRALADVDAPVARRCFLVCQPRPPPAGALRDAFSRFGDLIDVYTLPNKNVGYVKYASVRAAEEARRVLHGAELCGVRMKVLEAEEPRGRSSTTTTSIGGGGGSAAASNDPTSDEYDDRRKRIKIDGALP